MLMNSNEYITVVDNIKKEIRSAQYRTAVQANTELLRLYYSIGNEINVHKVWGNKFIENLSMDIRADYPTNKGFSVRNLKYMAKFAATYSEQEFVQQAVAQIPWGHNIVLLDKITDSEQRRWYAEACQKNGWSRNVLIHQIESGLYERQVLNSKVSNFKQRLPSPQSELATQTMKDMLSSVCSAYQLSARAFSILHVKNNQKLTNLWQVVSCRVGEKTVY